MKLTAFAIQWHATTAAKDVKATEDIFNFAFDNKPFDQLTMKDFVPGVLKAWGTVDPDPKTRTFAG